MKKLLNLLMILPVMLFVASCDDDDDRLPNVTFSVEYEGAVDVDNILYVVKGDNLTINSVSAIPVEGSKEATLGPVTYIWDYQVLGTTAVSPYALTINTSVERPGRHLLQMTSTVLQVDKAMASVNLAFEIAIVEKAEDIPGYTPDMPDSGTAKTNGSIGE